MADSCCMRPAGGEKYQMPAHPLYPQLRAGTQLDAMYDRLIASGHGFVKPGLAAGLPKAVVVFDTQCIWSHVIWNTVLPLQDEVEFHWYPVTVLGDLSTAQAAAILAADNPWQLMREHQEAWENEDFCGIRPEEFRTCQLDRKHVWENSRTFRKAGGTSVPLGVFARSGGVFVPFFGSGTLEDIRKVIGI